MGAFSKQGNLLKYAPSSFLSAPRLDPASRSFYEIIYFRFSDGPNASALGSARVLSFNADSRPSGAVDGIPDNWMLQFFGDINPAVGVKHKAGDDADGDGFTNSQEYSLGSNPVDASSKLQITSSGLGHIQWQAKPYELYEVQASSNLRDWTAALYPVLPTTTTGQLTKFKKTEPALFFRLLKVP